MEFVSLPLGTLQLPLVQNLQQQLLAKKDELLNHLEME